MPTPVAEVIIPELVALDVPPPSDRDALFDAMVARLSEAGRIGDPSAFRAALEEREALGSTYMGDELALPHGRSATVVCPSVVFWRLRSPMTYTSQDETGPVTRVVMLAVPAGSEGEHLRTLALFARLLMHDESVAALDAASSPQDVVEVVARFAEAHGPPAG